MRDLDVDDGGRWVLSAQHHCECCGGALGEHAEACASREITDEEVEALAAQATVDFDWIRLEEAASDSRGAAHGRLVLSHTQDQAGGAR